MGPGGFLTRIVVHQVLQALEGEPRRDVVPVVGQAADAVVLHLPVSHRQRVEACGRGGQVRGMPSVPPRAPPQEPTATGQSDFLSLVHAHLGTRTYTLCLEPPPREPHLWDAAGSLEPTGRGISQPRHWPCRHTAFRGVSLAWLCELPGGSVPSFSGSLGRIRWLELRHPVGQDRRSPLGSA